MIKPQPGPEHIGPRRPAIKAAMLDYGIACPDLGNRAHVRSTLAYVAMRAAHCPAEIARAAARKQGDDEDLIRAALVAAGVPHWRVQKVVKIRDDLDVEPFELIASLWLRVGSVPQEPQKRGRPSRETFDAWLAMAVEQEKRRLRPALNRKCKRDTEPSEALAVRRLLRRAPLWGAGMKDPHLTIQRRLRHARKRSQQGN